jgi:hypothetical protein
MKTVFWLVCLCSVFVAACYFLAIFKPMTYLKFYSDIGFGPLSLPWVVDMAKQGLEGTPQSYCEQPYLLVWNGSFGQLSTLPEGSVLPEGNKYQELVLGNTGIVREQTKNALTAMSDFNAKLIEICF